MRVIKFRKCCKESIYTCTSETFICEICKVVGWLLLRFFLFLHCSSLTSLQYLRTVLRNAFFLRCSSLASLPYLHTILRNALHLNTASLLHAVHGSLTPFPLAFYGCPFVNTCLPQCRLFPSIALPKPSFYIHLSSYATTPLGLCTT